MNSLKYTEEKEKRDDILFCYASHTKLSSRNTIWTKTHNSADLLCQNSHREDNSNQSGGRSYLPAFVLMTRGWDREHNRSRRVPGSSGNTGDNAPAAYLPWLVDKH